MADRTDFLVIGSGVAGMWFALKAAKFGKVTLVTKAATEESNSRYAQGGIAAVWSADDDYESHVEDTLVAGAGLCRREAVELTVREAPARIRDLIALGTRFTKRATTIRPSTACTARAATPTGGSCTPTTSPAPSWCAR